MPRIRGESAVARRFFSSLVISLLLVGACSTTSKMQNLPLGELAFPAPPLEKESPQGGDAAALALSLERSLQADPTEARRFWTRYRQAQLWEKADSRQACRLWIEIAGEPRFPLAAVARLHAIATCPADKTEITPWLEGLAGQQESWLRESAQRAGLAHALNTQDRKREMDFSLRVADFESPRAEQLRLMERAGSLARELGDAEATELARKKIEKLAPRTIKDPAPQEYLAVAADLRGAREFDLARETYRKIVQGADFNAGEKLRALDGIRMSYKLERELDRYLTATRAYATFARRKFFKSNPARYFEAQLTLARAVWTDGSSGEAEKILLNLEKEIKDRVPVEESVFVRARILEEGGRLAEAAKVLAGVDETKISERGLGRKFAWYRAWILRKNGQLKEAVEHLNRLILEEEDNSSLLTRDRYWLGRTLKEAGEADSAKTQFEWLIANDPLGYYGLLAHRELKRRLPAIGRPPPASEQIEVRAPASLPPSALAPEERLTLDWLVAVEESELARRFLDQINPTRRLGFNDGEALDYLHQYARAGAYQSLFARLTDLPSDIRRQTLERHPDLLFPRPWLPLVTSSAEKFAVKPELIFSIMRQESAFNRLARSSADALGLMQLIPQVAEGAAAANGVPYDSHLDLYQPEINIALGAAHLRQLLQRWHGLFIPAVASYNASERAVSGWLRTRDRSDPAQFIEDIPYEETKGYVKLVMRNYVFYSRLSTTEAEIDFPEWCLNGLQDFKP